MGCRSRRVRPTGFPIGPTPWASAAGLRTIDDAGGPRDTRTWVADADGASWIEAANPERPFLRDIAQRPDVEVWRAGTWLRCRATAIANPGGHDRIRQLLAAKYGWADRWVGRLTDTSQSSAVQVLGCTPGAARIEDGTRGEIDAS